MTVNNHGADRHLPGFRHILEASLFFGTIGGLADVSYIYTRNPDLIADLLAGLRLLTAGIVVSFLAFFVYLLIIWLILLPVSKLRKWQLELSLNILYMLAALPTLGIIARNYSMMTASESILVEQIKIWFYFLKYLFVIIPMSWAIGFWLANLRATTDISRLFGRLSGFALGAMIFMVITPMVQQKYLLARANIYSEVTSSKENFIITVGIFLAALILLPLFMWLGTQIAKVGKGAVLAIIWIIGSLIPYLPPLITGSDVHGTPPSGAALSGRSSNVILVSLDTFRYDDIGFNGSEIVRTPALDELAESSLVFDNAITPMPMTGPAHMSIFTGLQPDAGTGPDHGVKSNGIPLPNDIDTLATILDARGYNTAAVIGGFPLSRVASGLERGFHYYHDVFNEGLRARFLPDQVWYLTPAKLIKKFLGIKEGLPHGREKSADVVTDQALAWLADNSEKPFFLFVHYFDAHYLYAPPAPFDTMYMPDYDGPYKNQALAYADILKNLDSFTPADFGYYRSLYRGEISFVDDQFGRILDYCESSGLLDNTLLIVVSDHGESFEHNYYFNHTDRVYDQLIHVPMLIRDPDAVGQGSLPARSDALVNVSDIYWTVLDYLAIEPPRKASDMNLVIPGARSGWEHSLLDIAVNRPPDSAEPGWDYIASQSYSNVSPGELSLGRFFSFRFPKWHLIYGPDAQPHLPLFQYFELTSDPEEMNDMYPRIKWDETGYAGMPEMLEVWASMQAAADMSSLSPQMMEELKALGYVSAGPSSGADDTSDEDHWTGMPD